MNNEQVKRPKMVTLQLVSGKCLIQIFARLSPVLRDYVFPLPLQVGGLIVLNLGFQALFGLLAINFWDDSTE
jgi:hypothetical protein